MEGKTWPWVAMAATIAHQSNTLVHSVFGCFHPLGEERLVVRLQIKMKQSMRGDARKLDEALRKNRRYPTSDRCPL